MWCTGARAPRCARTRVRRLGFTAVSRVQTVA